MERQFKSSRGGGVTYTVKVRDDGTATCSCPAFKIRKMCRHIEEVERENVSEETSTPRQKQTLDANEHGPSFLLVIKQTRELIQKQLK